MNCLAVDPGKRAGWAALSNGDIVESGIVTGDDPEVAWELISKYAPLNILVIEDQYFPRGRNARGIKTLFFRRCLWEITARLLKMEIEVVHPMTWQSHFKLKRGDKGAFAGRASAIVGRDVDYDEADAILMAQWWAGQQRLAKFIQTAGGK